MIAVWMVVVMLFGHWVSDFVFQPHWMSMRKSKEWWVLAQHALRILGGGVVAAAVIALFSSAALSGSGLLWWAFLGGLSHFAIDAVTSRITSKFWAQQKVHEFFTTIGFDQFLHVAFAVLSFWWLVL